MDKHEARRILAVETFADYIDLCVGYAADYPSWRWGQTLFNVLAQVRPDLAEKYRGAAFDPFYNDDHAADFLAHVEDAW